MTTSRKQQLEKAQAELQAAAAKIVRYAPRLHWPVGWEPERELTRYLCADVSISEIVLATRASRRRVIYMIRHLAKRLDERSVSADYWHLSAQAVALMDRFRAWSRPALIARFGQHLHKIDAVSGVGSAVAKELRDWCNFRTARIEDPDFTQQPHLIETSHVAYLQDLKHLRRGLKLQVDALEEVQAETESARLRRQLLRQQLILVEEFILRYGELLESTQLQQRAL